MSRSTWGTSRCGLDFVYGPFTLCGGTFQNTSTILATAISRPRNPNRQAGWFGLVPFRSPLLRESLAFYFPRGTEMFHFPRFRFPGLLYSTWNNAARATLGFPIRTSPDQSVFATPRSLSQLTTSFFAFRCQGIHRALVLCLTK